MTYCSTCGLRNPCPCLTDRPLAAASGCARRVERRNLFVHVDDSVKLALKSLAKRSRMTLEQYVVAILSEAAETKPVFKLQAVKVGHNTRISESREE
jgi:hypothetical protein